MTQISKVTPMAQYQLEILFSNNTTVILNMTAKLGNIRFMALKDKLVFNNVTTDGQYIRWGNFVEISVNEIFYLAQK